LSEAFNPDAKFKALTSSLSGVAGGFSALQGAMGIFGANTKDVEKALLKVQSAMAISQGLQSLGESIDSFKQLGLVIKDTTLYQSAYNFVVSGTLKGKTEELKNLNESIVAKQEEASLTEDVTSKMEQGKKAIEEVTMATSEQVIATETATGTQELKAVAVEGAAAADEAGAVAAETNAVAQETQAVATTTATTATTAATVGMKLLRLALMGTGIGLLIAGITALVANFDNIKKAIFNLIPGLGKVADFIGGLVNKVTDFIGITSEAGRATAKLIKDNEESIKSGERFLDLNADKYDKYTQRKMKANIDFKKKENEFLKDSALSQKQRDEFIKEARDKADREIKRADDDRQKEVSDNNKKIQDKIDEQNRKVEQKQKEHNDKIKKLEEDAVKELQDIRTELIKADQTDREKELTDLEVEYNKKKKILIDGNQSTEDLDKLYQKQKDNLNKKFQKEDLKKEQDFQDELAKIKAKNPNRTQKSSKIVEAKGKTRVSTQIIGKPFQSVSNRAKPIAGRGRPVLASEIEKKANKSRRRTK
jgi:hypothetical protein